LIIIVLIILIIVIFWLLRGGAGQSAYMSAGDPINGPNAAVYADMKNLIDKGKIVAPSESPEPDKTEVPSEKEFLLGKKHPTVGHVDVRLLKSLVYLGEKHERIYVRNVLYPYVYMPVNTIETKNTKDNTFEKSISAHKEGKAADISQIDKGCKKNLEVSWQDDPVQTETEDRGIQRDEAINILEESMGLAQNSLEGKNFEEILQNTGQAELERYFKLEPGSLDGKDLNEVISNWGQREFNEKLNLPYEVNGVNFDQYVIDLAQTKIEEVFGLPNESLRGQNLQEIAINLGQTKIEKELGLPAGTLTNKDSLKFYAQNKWGDQVDENLLKIAADLDLAQLGLSERILIDLFHKAEAGQDLSFELKNIGGAVLANSLDLPQGTNIFTNYMIAPDPGGFSIDYQQTIVNQFWQSVTDAEIGSGLPEGSIKNFLNAMAKGENPQDYFRNIGSDIIDNNIGWKARTAYQLATGAIGVEQALANTDYSISDLSARWNVSEQSVRNFLSGNISAAIKEEGQLRLSSTFNLPYDLAGDLINGRINYQTALSLAGINLNDLAKQWDVPINSLTSFMSGDIKGAATSYGIQIMKENFKMSDAQINAALTLIQTGDIKGAAEQFAKNYALNAIGVAFGLPPGTIQAVLMVIENPELLLNPLKQLGSMAKEAISGISKTIKSILSFGGIFGRKKCSTRDKVRAKIHQVTKELLEMPAANIPKLGLPDRSEMRVTQLIVWSYERDVMPLEIGTEQPTLDYVYGTGRQPNYGLFATKGNNYLLDHIHVGY